MAEDVTGDGLYDRLTAEIELEISAAWTGDYSWSADLVDGRGRVITNLAGTVTFSGTGRDVLSIEVDGYGIGAAGVDGPYFLQNVEFWQLGSWVNTLQDMGGSPAYGAREFDGYEPFEQEIVDHQTLHRDDGFILRWNSTTGVWYDVEYAENPFGTNWIPVPNGMGLAATPPVNSWTQTWRGSSNHWFHYQVRPRRIR